MVTVCSCQGSYAVWKSLELDLSHFQVWISVENGRKFGNIFVFTDYCDKLAQYVVLNEHVEALRDLSSCKCCSTDLLHVIFTTQRNLIEVIDQVSAFYIITSLLLLACALCRVR